MIGKNRSTAGGNVGGNDAGWRKRPRKRLKPLLAETPAETGGNAEMSLQVAGYSAKAETETSQYSPSGNTARAHARTCRGAVREAAR